MRRVSRLCLDAADGGHVTPARALDHQLQPTAADVADGRPATIHVDAESVRIATLQVQREPFQKATALGPRCGSRRARGLGRLAALVHCSPRCAQSRARATPRRVHRKPRVRLLRRWHRRAAPSPPARGDRRQRGGERFCELAHLLLAERERIAKAPMRLHRRCHFVSSLRISSSMRGL